MGQPAGGSLTADQWLIAATVICPIAVSLSQSSSIVSDQLYCYCQVPQIWDQYASGDAETIRLKHLGDFKLALEKKKEAQAAARQVREAAWEAATAKTARRSGRKRQRTARSEVLCPLNEGLLETDIMMKLVDR